MNKDVITIGKFVQVEAEYATVHQQLAVAIEERDQAVRRCVDESSKLVRVQEAFT